MFVSFQGRAPENEGLPGAGTPPSSSSDVMVTATTATTTNMNNNNNPHNHSTSSSASSNSQHSLAQVRLKRSQVARACDWCRTLRIKCDNERPCQSCRSRGERCESKGSTVRTLPSALKEIDSLKAKIADLEAQLEAAKAVQRQHQQQQQQQQPQQQQQQQQPTYGVSGIPTPASSTAGSPDAFQDPLSDHGQRKRHWEGIQARAFHSPQTQFYGPSSSYYFTARINSYLEAVLQQPQPEYHLMPKSASRAFISPSTLRRGDDLHTMGGQELTRAQEQYWLGMFWQSYHCTYQIFDESEFRDHYASLWTTGAEKRQDSALVDIVLAICMQYGAGFIPRGSSNDVLPDMEVDSDDGSIAGRWYYTRCQTLLQSEIENPSLTTLQSQLLAVVYLCNATFVNMAYTWLGYAIRTAFVIGLHHEPSEQLPRQARELRKRLWWTLFTVETKTCMKLGRPWSVQLADVTCALPSDDHALAAISGSNFLAIDENATWLTYNIQTTKLLLIVRSVFVSFFDRCSALLGANDGEGLYNDPRSLGLAADYLMTSMKSLHSWPHTLPAAMKTQRKADGEPYSTDRSLLAVDPLAPLWLQRQRLVLEMLYHNLCMNLYRPFISFSAFTDSGAPSVEGCAISCLNHAVTITNIMHQVLTQTDILNGWHEGFQWQWNATLSLIGFVLANPLSPSCTSARKALDSATLVFEMMGGNNFAIAANAAAVTREWKAKSELIMNRFCSGVADPNPMQFLAASTGGNSGSNNPSTHSSANPSPQQQQSSMQLQPQRQLSFAESGANHSHNNPNNNAHAHTSLDFSGFPTDLDDATSAFIFNRMGDHGAPDFGFDTFMTPFAHPGPDSGF